MDDNILWCIKCKHHCDGSDICYVCHGGDLYTSVFPSDNEDLCIKCQHFCNGSDICYVCHDGDLYTEMPANNETEV